MDFNWEIILAEKFWLRDDFSWENLAEFLEMNGLTNRPIYLKWSLYGKIITKRLDIQYKIIFGDCWDTFNIGGNQLRGLGQSAQRAQAISWLAELSADQLPVVITSGGISGNFEFNHLEFNWAFGNFSWVTGEKTWSKAKMILTQQTSLLECCHQLTCFFLYTLW